MYSANYYRLNRILDSLPLFAVFYFATTPSAAAGAPDPGSGGAPPAGGGTPGAASPSTAGPSAPTIDWNTAPEQFRNGYEKLKSDYEKLQGEYKPWQDWAKESGVTHDQLSSVHGTYQEVYEEINGLAEALGRADDEIAEAVDKHGVLKVLDYLRTQYAKAEESRSPDTQSVEEAVEAALAQRMGPIEERENIRLTDAANDRFEQIIHSSIVEAYKAEGVDVAQIPQAESFMLMNAASEILKYDEKALVALKQGKGQAEVQKAFHEAKNYLDQYYLSRSGRERGRIQGPPKIQPPGQAARKPTLDEMIEEPTLVNAKYKIGT